MPPQNPYSAAPQTPQAFAMLIKISDWLRDYYLPIILSGLLIGFLIGTKNTTPGQEIKKLSPLLTFLMMFFVSLSISPSHFLYILRKPLPILMGLLLNFLLLPVLCWIVAAFMVPDRYFSAGILLIGLVPSAVNASVWTAMLDGDTAVSMAINACSMLLASLLIPPIMSTYLATQTPISVSSVIQQVFILLIVPLMLGLTLQALWVKSIAPFRRMLPVGSAMIGVVFAFGTCNLNTPTLISQRHLIPPMLAAAIIIFPGMFAISNGISRHFFPETTAIPVTFAGSMKNLSVAMGIAFANFPSAVVLPITIFSIPHMVTSVLFYQYLKWRQNHSTKTVTDSSRATFMKENVK